MTRKNLSQKLFSRKFISTQLVSFALIGLSSALIYNLSSTPGLAQTLNQPGPTNATTKNPIIKQQLPSVAPQATSKTPTTTQPKAQLRQNPAIEPSNQPVNDIWTDVNVQDPKLSIKQDGNTDTYTSSPQRPLTNRELINSTNRMKPKRPSEIIRELQDPNTTAPKNSLINSGDDPAGRDLEKRLPLDEPLSERLSRDVLDPIELDVDQDDILDLNIEKALLISLESNLPQRIIDETVIRDKWRFWTTTSGLLPDGFYSYSLNDQSIASTALGSGTNHISRLGMRYNLAPSEIFGTMASYYDWMANSEFQGANLQDLMRRTLNQYYEVMRARGELSVRIEAVKQAKIQLALNEKLDQAGVGTRFAVLQAREQLAENQLALLSQQSTSRISEIQLLTTMNLPLGTDIRLEETELSKSTLVSPEYSITELVDLAIGNRPDIRRRQLSRKAAKHRVKQSFANAFLPALTSQAFLFGQTTEPGSPGRSPGDAFRLNESQFTLGVELPILTGLGLGQISPINENRAVARQTGLELENEILNIESEVRDSFLRSQAADKRIGIAEKQLQAATEGIKLARIRLANGVGTNIDLIDTQRNYVNALVNKVRAIVEYNQSQADILRSIGLISLDSIINKDYVYKAGDASAQVEEDEDDEFQDAGYGSEEV